MKDIFKIPQGNYFCCKFRPEILVDGKADDTKELQDLEVMFVPASGIGRPVNVKKVDGLYEVELPTDFALGVYAVKFIGKTSEGRPVRFVESPFIEIVGSAEELYIPENVDFAYTLNSLSVPTYPTAEQETEEPIVPEPSDTPNTDEAPGQGSQFIPNEGSNEQKDLNNEEQTGKEQNQE